MIAFMKMTVLIIIIIHVLIQIIKDIKNNDNKDIDEYYDYCRGCQSGFCMAEPKSEECQKWRKINGNKDREQDKDIKSNSTNN